MIYEDTYPSLIQGVSQQTPQERLDGQLGAQVNMLSDPVNGLRRRSGFKLHGRLNVPKDTKFDFIQLGGEYYIQCVTSAGRLVIVRFSDQAIILDAQYPYLVNTNKGTIRSAISQNQCYILNTEQVPAKVLDPITPVVPRDSTNLGVLYLQSGTIVGSSSNLRATVKIGSSTYSKIYTGTAYTAQYTTVAQNLYNQFLADTAFRSVADVYLTGTVLSFVGVVPTTTVEATYSKQVDTPAANTLVVVQSGTTHTYAQRSALPPTLPAAFDKYSPYIGTTRYMYNATVKAWGLFRETTANLNPKFAGWIRVMSGAFSKTYTAKVTQGTTALEYSVTTSTSTASQATPEYVATQFETQMLADTTFTTAFNVLREGTTLAVLAKGGTEQVILEGLGGDLYVTASGGSVIKNKDVLPPTLPATLAGYIQGVGQTSNLTYFQYDHETRTWKECGAYEDRYTIQNTPMYWYYDYTTKGVVVSTLEIQGRSAGDDNNNPEPSFMDFGFTGISAYQSRLILLSGAYVCMSKSNDPSIFMRTTVEEVLDDDPIEISATSLSNSQFEYAVPYNKDLILFSQTQQAVIPANNTVLTPKSAVIYPSTQAEVSLAVRPIVAARSLYYAYQRGLDYYQVGEMIPNPYTDSQYNPQNLTDHLPLYAEGVCTGMAGSSTNNSVMFTSDTPEVLVNQFIWQGDTRSIMGFHKWELPRNVLDVAFLQEYSILFLEDTDGGTLVCTTNTQLNQLKDKPVPYLDIYQYVETDSNGEGTLEYMPEGDLVAVAYDDRNYRHMELALTVDRVAGTIKCNHTGTVAIGLRFGSYFTLTPPYIKDQNGKVLAGVKSTVHSFPLTFRNTGEFKYMVSDFVGEVGTVDTSAATWSEVNLGYTWINSISTSVVPCRSRLDGLTCTIFTDKTTDMNLTTAGYVLRTSRKHPRPRG